MNANKRQVAIVYELITSEGFHTYEELCQTFSVSLKTMRRDIQTINDSFNLSGIYIESCRGKGFKLTSRHPEQIDELKKQFQYRFIGSDDLQGSFGSRKNQILFDLFTNGKYTRLDELSLSLNLNSRSISSALVSVRSVLATYHISLTTRPHYGMFLEGREIDIRYCYTDTVCFYSEEKDTDLFNDSLSRLHLEENEKEQITKICLRYLKESGCLLSEVETRKLIVLIMISHKRILNKRLVEFTAEQKEIIDQYSSRILHMNILISDIERYYNESIPQEERDFLKMFILCNLDYSAEKYRNALDTKILMLARKLLKALIRELKDNSIVGRRNQAEFEKYLYPVMIEKSIRTSFQLNEHNPNAFLKKAVIKSPLSASIGRICSAKIEKILSQNQGEMMYIRIALAIYECIRKTNTTIMNDIAVLTPDDRSGGESLKHRVLDRYSNIIRSIDVLTLTDVLRQDMTKYSCVLLFENEKPLGLNDKVKQLQVDYFFVERDVKNFYEEVAIPSRRYERAFAIPKAEDYIRNCKITSLDEIKEKMIPQISSQSLIRQLREYQISTVDICNYTLNVILFAADDSECFSKLITLSKEMVYKERHFARIFIHAVCLNGNMVRLKTAEKVIRNLTQIEDTNENILTDHPIDFYDYYIYGQKVDCPEGE